MEELSIRDLEELAKAGISITFTKWGNDCTKGYRRCSCKQLSD